MHITVEWFSGEKPQFNVSLASRQGAEPFLTIKGCRIVEGAKGAFVSWPATRNQSTGKYWNHVYGSEAFNAHVMKVANESRPSPARKTPTRMDEDDDVPF